MCSNRNTRRYVRFTPKILDHWEMCSNRNPGHGRWLWCGILDHWEMCSNRNQEAADKVGAQDFRSLGNVL